MYRGPHLRDTSGRRPAAVACRCALILLAACPSCAPALETDQYYAWGEPLTDAGSIVNAKFNLEIRRAVASCNAGRAGRRGDADSMTRAVMHRLRFVILQDIEVWAVNSPLVPRIPQSFEATVRYRGSNLYNGRGPFDLSGWLPDSPTIEIDGTRFGTDKLAHFVSGGWRYYRRYLSGRHRGLSPVAAEERAIRIGIAWEDTILGSLSTGVLSLGDLEANYQGMLFYRDLCGGDDPVLAHRDGTWHLRRPFDIGWYIRPEWDESYQPAIIADRRWRRVQPMLADYRKRLALPSVRARRARYRQRDTVTPTERVLNERIRDRKLANPASFALGTGGGDFVRAIATHTEPHLPARAPPRAPDEALIAELDIRDGDRKAVLVGLTGLQATYPAGAIASAGLLLANLTAEDDPRTISEFKGAFVQAGAGPGGARASLGWARLYGERWRNDFWLADYFLGYGVKASVLHTFDAALDREPGGTFLGAEAAFTIVRVNFLAGVFRAVHGPETDTEPWLITGGIGYGF